MGCTPAPACKAVLEQANQIAPHRAKASDGICASPKHTQQNPSSDHETGDAVDLTHSPQAGCDVDRLFYLIIQRRDRRVKYLIWRRRICRSYAKGDIPAWTWAPYSGSNPHEKHGHISIHKALRADTGPWFGHTTTITEDEDMPLTPEDKKWITDVVYGIVHDQLEQQVPKLVRDNTPPPSGNTGNASIVGKYQIEVTQ